MLPRIKLERYNHILWAILGSLTLVVVLATGLYLSYNYVKPTFFRPERQHDIIAPDKTEPPKRYSIVQLKTPQVLDKELKLFAIPVTQEKLDKPVLLEGKTMAYDAPYRPYSSRLNNIILYDHITSKRTLVFTTRHIINRFIYVKGSKNSYLVSLATDTDSNNNQRLDPNDKMAVHWIDIHSQKRQQVSLTESATSILYFGHYHSESPSGNGLNDDEVLIETRKADGASAFYILNLRSGKTSILVSDDLLKRVQSVLDRSPI